MCPSYMATRDEQHSTRGRAPTCCASAMTRPPGRGGPRRTTGCGETLDLCLECRACKAECPVGVDVARFKSEFLADYYARHGTPIAARVLGHASLVAKAGSLAAPLANWAASLPAVKRLNEAAAGARRAPHAAPVPVANIAQAGARDWRCRRPRRGGHAATCCSSLTRSRTTTTRRSGWRALERAARRRPVSGLAPNQCCGRPQISKGLLPAARDLAVHNTARLYAAAQAGAPLVFCEPSCLSAIREDVPALLRGDQRRRAEVGGDDGRALRRVHGRPHRRALPLRTEARTYLLHGHCHQKSMGLVSATKTLLSSLPGATVVDVDAGCCGMAGSFGYCARPLRRVARDRGTETVPRRARPCRGHRRRRRPAPRAVIRSTTSRERPRPIPPPSSARC